MGRRGEALREEGEETLAPRVTVVECTLAELVEAIGDVTEDDREVVATLRHLLDGGRVRRSRR
jgi:hypothetical protein